MNRSKRLNTILDIVIISLLCIYAAAGMIAVPFHGDESTLVNLSYDYERIFVEHDYDAVRFLPVEPPRSWHGHEQYQRIMTGSIDPLSIGLARQFAGLTADDLNTPWEWFGLQNLGSYDEYERNIDHGARPSDRLLAVSRIPSTLMLVASIVLIFLITRLISGSRPAAWVASLIYTLTPSVLVNGRRAMQEGALLFTTLLLVWIAVRIIKGLREGKLSPTAKALWLAGLGLAGGFATACKHTAAIVFGVALLVLLIVMHLRPVRPEKIRFFDVMLNVNLLLGSGMLAIAVFYVLMPIWWSWPRAVIFAATGVLLIAVALPNRTSTWVIHGAAVLAVAAVAITQPGVWQSIPEPPAVIAIERGALIENQVNGMERRLATPGSRIAKLFTESFFGRTEYYESPAWADFEVTAAEIAAYERAGLNGSGGSTVWGILLIGLLVAGSAAFREEKYKGSHLLISLWYVIPAVFLLITNPLPWQRYYIMLIAPLAVLQGIGAAWVIEQIRERAGSRSKEAEAATG